MRQAIPRPTSGTWRRSASELPRAGRRELPAFAAQGARSPAASAEKVLGEAMLYDDAAAALDGARLELDQAALVRLA